MAGNWRDGYQEAYKTPSGEPEAPGLVWRETHPNHWSGSWASLPRGTIMLESATDLWLAYVQLEEPPGLSPMTTVGRFATAGDAIIATDEIWASR